MYRLTAASLLFSFCLTCVDVSAKTPDPQSSESQSSETRGTLTRSENTGPPTRRALLIGIDEYAAPGVRDLKGAVNDVALMRAILIDKFDTPAKNIATLTDEQATRAAIIKAIQDDLIAKANPEDVVILHFSGHGSTIKDRSGDEVDGFDETLVPHDGRTEGVFDITDDEINGLLHQLTQKTKKVTFILDSCHSGSAVRGGNAARIVAADERPPPPPEPFALSVRSSGEGLSGFRLNDSDYVLISGCRATQLSNEASFNGNRHGVMTWFLAHALRAANENATYRSVMDEVSAEVSARYPSQHPQIEGRGTDLKVFGTDRYNTSPYALVEKVDGDRLEIGVGRVYGVQADAQLEVYDAQTHDFDAAEPIATIEIQRLEDFKAFASVVEGGPVKQYSKVSLRSLYLGAAPFPVYVDGPNPEIITNLKRQLTEAGLTALVDHASDARLIVDIGDVEVSLRWGDLELAATPIPRDTPNLVGEVVESIKDVVHWISVMDLKNPSSTIDFTFDMQRSSDPEGSETPGSVAPNTELQYQIVNLDSEPIYVYVLDVSSDGSIALLYPPVDGAQEVLLQGIPLVKKIKVFLPPSQSSVVDVFKVIASSQPINSSVFPQGAMRRSAEDLQLDQYSDPMDRFWAASLNGVRGSVPVDERSWATQQKTITIQPAGVRFSGFAVHLDAPVGADLPSSFGDSRSTCDAAADDLSDCFEVTDVFADGLTIELLTRRSTRRDPQSLDSVGALFDEAYRIQDEVDGAMRVEPLLEVELPGRLDQRGIEKRDVSSGAGHNRLAEQNDRWHLAQLSATEAWQQVRDHKGVAEGQEAKGVLVAHIDTGYREHPENWQQVAGQRPIDPNLGYDYYDSDDDPTDPLLDGRFLDNPGHGTASGSVIVSPADCQLAGQPGCVHGIGRGAQLVPLRVHRAALWLSYHASDPEFAAKTSIFPRYCLSSQEHRKSLDCSIKPLRVLNELLPSESP